VSTAGIIHTVNPKMVFQIWLPELTNHRHPARHRVGECDGCGRSFKNVPLAPVLEDVVWCKLAAAGEVLCAGYVASVVR
jgi:hypothetical protein